MHSWKKRNELFALIGRLSQVGGISPFEYADGKAKGTRTLRVRTASGLEFWVVPDKGMDIYEASFRGQSLCWHSPCGMVHPAYYSNRGAEWLKGFAGGLLTTCGLSTAGAPSQDLGEELGLHGSISNTPAENVCWSEEWDGDNCVFRVSGDVREASVHGPNLLLKRVISSSLKSTALTIHDIVENQGVTASPLMVLYHCNFGFPLLTSKSKIYSSSQKIEPIDDISAEGLDRWNVFDSPQMNLKEQVYFHEMKAGIDRATVVLISDREKQDYGVALSYDPVALPQFNQWKMTSANHFVLGLEPANCRTRGRAHERERGTLQILEPGEQREFRLEIRILEGELQVQDAIRMATIDQLP